jgi:hypothetical protein
MNYATDTDLLHWEPALFKDAALPSQKLLAGSGDLAGTTFTIASGSFTDAGVAVGHVLFLGGTINGCFAITAINSATSIEISVLYDLLLADGVPVATATGVAFKIQTAAPQLAMVSQMIRDVLGVPDPDQILNPEVLRRTTALGTLQMLYNATAAISIDGVDLSRKAAVYQSLYQRSLRAVQVEIDRNGDGEPDQVLCPGVPRLVRSA